MPKVEGLDVADYIHYDPASGEFTWSRARQGAKIGGVAGLAHPEGYWVVSFNYGSHIGGQVAWEIMTGSAPPESCVVHHKDGNRLNCKWENLCLEEKSPSWEPHDMLSYDPHSGVFKWKYAYGPGGKPLPESVGFLSDGGYIRIGTNRKGVQAHRLAYRFMTGNDVPKGYEIDHINGDRADNRWINLRLVTRSQNNMNAVIRSNNTSGVKGVSFDRRRGLWSAEIKVNGKKTFLGRFATIEEAAARRKKYEDELFGEYSIHNSRKQRCQK